MSATMDDDEPIFRRYYHIINDNLVYPLRSPLNYFNDTELYDSIYLDRRLHIAPPGISTQHKITEFYVPNKTVEEVVLDILSNSTSGDILIFENGTTEINKRIQSLNKITPSNVIALPYTAKINSKYKNIIEKINVKIYNVRTNKNIVCDVWTDTYIESKDVIEGTYNRTIIIATNVAEASLTITSLKYVIDNGYSKINNYDDVFDKTNLFAEMIPESNRKQRKGRVGRVSSGTVYYLYEKGGREKVKQQYKINQINFGESLLQLLESKLLSPIIYDEPNTLDEIEELIDIENGIEYDNAIVSLPLNYNESLLIRNFDPNYVFLKNKELTSYFNFNVDNKISFLKDSVFKNTKFYKKNIFNIIIKQFYNNNYIQYWNKDYYSNINDNLYKCLYKLDSGYMIDILFDMYGLFYIIHPFENKIKRNILGDIIEYKLMDKWETIKKLPIIMFNNLINNLTYKLLLINIKANNYNYLKFKDISILNLYKTELFNYTAKLRKYININELTINDIIILLTSKAYGSFNEVLEILTMIKTIKLSMKNLIIDIKIYNGQDIEIEYIHTLIQNFKNTFTYIDIFKFDNLQTIKKKYEKQINKIISDYLLNRTNFKNKYPVKLLNKLNYLYLNGLLKKNGFDYLIIDELIKEYDFEKNKKDIIKWCNINNINDELFIEYLNTYIFMKIELLTTNKNIDPKTPEISPFELMENESYNFKKSLLWTNKYEHIIRPFLHGYPFNIGIKFNTSDVYYHSIPDILVHNNYKKNNCNLLFYYHSGDNKDTSVNYKFNISITNKIEIDWLFNILPIYYKPSNFKNYIASYYENKIILNNYTGDLYDEFCFNLKNKWSLNNIPYIDSKMPIMSQFLKNYKDYSILHEN
jgi:hypothetical protein